MTTLQEARPCPFCGKQHTLQVISGQELMDENQEFWQHSESFGVVCDASTPDGKGGCGAMGGFKPTEEEAIEAWNRRTALAQQELPQKERPDFMAGYDAGMADAKRMAQQGEPVAYITDTWQGPMVWTPEMYNDACTYCDDGEFPVPLYTVTPRPTSGDYALGYAEGFNDACKPAPQAQDVTELVELLEFMWRDVSMNEYAFEKLEAALFKYKGAK